MTELRIERHLAARPERVWRALTDADALAAWFWPARLHTQASAEPRPGGAFRIAATTSEMAVSGMYTVVEPPYRLAFTWQWDGDATESLVTIELAALGAGTTLVLTHAQLADEIDRANHETGWSDCLDRLPGYLEDDADDDDDAGEDGDEPPARRRRSATEPSRPNRPRLLGGAQDIEQAMRPTGRAAGQSATPG